MQDRGTSSSDEYETAARAPIRGVESNEVESGGHGSSRAASVPKDLVGSGVPER